MKQTLRPALVLLIVLSVLTGLIYPSLMVLAGKTLSPRNAGGGLIERNGKLVGAELIGQNFEQAKYFWGRPSATTPNPDNAASTGGSNLGPLNPALADAVKQRIEALRKAGAPANMPVPADLVTASGSGVDPHISVAAAQYQAQRIALERGLPREIVSRLVLENTEQPDLGFLGEARVNVLKLNLALDSLAHQR